MRVILVSHFSNEFAKDTVRFYEYFRKILKIPKFKIHFYNSGDFDEGIKIHNFLKKAGKIKETLVVYYGGHGYRKGWKLSDKYKISYKTIINSLCQHKRPIIFVNDCCFGMALKDYLLLLQCPYLLLSLSPKTMVGYGSLVSGVITCWKARKSADPRLWVNKANELTSFILKKCAQRLRYGKKLDYLCYPKK